MFDKTGTLTKGVFKVTHTAPVDGVSEKDLLESAALAESFSSHPISKSLREACPDLDARRASDAQEIAGHGVKTQVDGHTVLAGNARRRGRKHHSQTEQVQPFFLKKLLDMVHLAPSFSCGNVVYAVSLGRPRRFIHGIRNTFCIIAKYNTDRCASPENFRCISAQNRVIYTIGLL